MTLHVFKKYTFLIQALLFPLLLAIGFLFITLIFSPQQVHAQNVPPCGTTRNGECGTSGCGPGQQPLFEYIDDTPCNPSNPFCTPVCQTWDFRGCFANPSCNSCTPGSQIDRGCGAGHCWDGYRYIDRCRDDGSGYDFLECRADSSCSGGCNNNGVCDAGEDIGSCPADCGSTCTPTDPTAATNVSPADGATTVSITVPLQWNPPSSWGTACPTVNNRFRIQVQENCSGPFVNEDGWFPSSQTNYDLDNLQWDTQYCWRITSVNGSGRYSYSTRTSFRTPAGPTIIPDGPAGIVLYRDSPINTCGSQYSGRSGDPQTSNPLTFSISSSTTAGTLRFTALALLPQTGSYAENAAIVRWGTARSKAISANTFLAGYDLQMQELRTTVGAGDTWTPVTSGDVLVSQNSATILDVNGATGGTVTGSNATTTFRVRFEDAFPPGMYNVYALVDVELADGTIISSAPTPTSARNMELIGTWGIDTQAPAVSLGEPTRNFLSPGEFTITHLFNDTHSGVVTRELYTASNDTGAQLQSNIAGVITFPVANTFAFTNQLSTVLTSTTYTDLTPARGATYQFEARVSDAACNVSTDRVETTGFQRPWLLALDAPIASTSGISTSIPDQVLDLLSVVPFDSAATLTNSAGYSGSVTYPLGSGSNKLFDIIQYPGDLFALPPQTNIMNWYEFLRDKAEKNRGEIFSRNQDTVSGNISSALSAQPGDVKAFVVSPPSGTLTVQAGTVCDIDGVVFVAGDLVLEPPFTNTSENTACTFVVEGATTLGRGEFDSRARVGKETLALYDQINAFIVSDHLHAPIDEFSGGDGGLIVGPGFGDGGFNVYKNEGLLVQGGIAANTVQFERDIGEDDNILQPAMIISYDPRYALSLQSFFGSRFYSIREAE